MTGKTAVVFGGAGNIGSCVAAGFLVLGHSKVVIVSRGKKRLDEAKVRISAKAECGDRLVGVTGDIMDETNIEDLKTRFLAAAGGKIDHIVISVGYMPAAQPLISQASIKELDDVLRAQVYGSFNIWKHFYPCLKDNEQGSFIFITGGGGDNYLPGFGLLSIAGGARRGMATAAEAESANDKAFVAAVPDPSQMPKNDYVKVVPSKVAGQYVVDLANGRIREGTSKGLIGSEDDIVRFQRVLNE